VNEVITTRFDNYQKLLIQSPAITGFIVLKQNVTRLDGRIRVRASLTDGGLLEFAEYIALNDETQVTEYTYTFHWQDTQQQLVRRWDNVNHFPNLPHAPHHIHQANENVVGNPYIPALEVVLAEIEDNLFSRKV
jgi:hypothetical protein